jgi:hypothetical protein
MSGVSAKIETITLSPEEYRAWTSPGQEISCSRSTGPLEISIDGGASYALFERGITVTAPHEANEVFFRNPSQTESVQFDFVQASQSGVWQDNRELGELDINGGVEILRAKTLEAPRVVTVTDQPTLIANTRPERLVALIQAVEADVWFSSEQTFETNTRLNVSKGGAATGIEASGPIYARCKTGETTELEIMETTL